MPRGRRLFLLLVAAFVVAPGLTLALAADAALTAKSELERARGGLFDARGRVGPGRDDVGADQLGATLATARRHVARAEDELDGWPSRAMARTPVIGRPWEALRVLVAAIDPALRGAELIQREGPSLVQPTGRVDLPATASLAERLDVVAREAQHGLAELDTVETGLTPNAVADGVRSAREQLSPAVNTLTRAAAAAGVAAGLLGADGPRQLMVVLENNAELRGTGGYVSTFATGRVERAGIALQPFRDVAAVSDPPARSRRVPAPAGYVEDYGPFLADTTFFRNWNMSPDIPTSAAVAAEVAGLLLTDKPDIVLLLDVPALGKIAGLSGGGVTLADGTSLPADQLVQRLLVEEYAEAGTASSAQIARRAELRQAATQAVEQLLAGSVPPLELLRTLDTLARGRHLALWSQRLAEQSKLVELGVAGAVDPGGRDLSMVTANNLGANKLDVYADRQLSLRATVGRDHTAVVQTVRLANQAPGGLVPYVAGTIQPGTLVERVEIAAAADARLSSFRKNGVEVPAAVDQSGPWTQITTNVEVPRGEVVELELQYRLPTGGGYEVTLIPQPLAHDAGLELVIVPEAGENLGEVTGAEVVDGRVNESTALNEQRTVRVALSDVEPTGRWQRLRDAVVDFWTSPVSLG